MNIEHHAPTVIEICAGGGGQSLGLEQAGFQHVAAVELDLQACATLRLNRPGWSVIEKDIRELNGADYYGIDLLAGGVPCPPFSVAGQQLGEADERNMFPTALRLIREARPRAVLLENVTGRASPKFRPYRESLLAELTAMGYAAACTVVNACDHDVPQLRPRVALTAIQHQYAPHFLFPTGSPSRRYVGPTLLDLMAARGWPGAIGWAERAAGIAPTLVGGSKKHGGPDLGPTRARRRWAELGVNGISLADEAPSPDFPQDGLPRLTVRMAARIQGFPDEWQFAGRKTAQYRQVGNAFPPPVARSIGRALRAALEKEAR